MFPRLMSTNVIMALITWILALGSQNIDSATRSAETKQTANDSLLRKTLHVALPHNVPDVLQTLIAEYAARDVNWTEVADYPVGGEFANILPLRNGTVFIAFAGPGIGLPRTWWGFIFDPALPFDERSKFLLALPHTPEIPLRIEAVAEISDTAIAICATRHTPFGAVPDNTPAQIFTLNLQDKTLNTGFYCSGPLGWPIARDFYTIINSSTEIRSYTMKYMHLGTHGALSIPIENGIDYYRLPDGLRVKRITIDSNTVTLMLQLKNGSWVTCLTTGLLQLFTAEGIFEKTFGIPITPKIFPQNGSIRAICEDVDGTLVVASVDGKIRRWNLASGACLKTIPEENFEIDGEQASSYISVMKNIQQLHDGYFITNAHARSAAIWDLESGKCLKIFNKMNGDFPVQLKDGRLLTCKRGLQIWENDTYRRFKRNLQPDLPSQEEEKPSSESKATAAEAPLLSSSSSSSSSNSSSTSYIAPQPTRLSLERMIQAGVTAQAEKLKLAATGVDKNEDLDFFRGIVRSMPELMEDIQQDAINRFNMLSNEVSRSQARSALGVITPAPPSLPTFSRQNTPHINLQLLHANLLRLNAR